MKQVLHFLKYYRAINRIWDLSRNEIGCGFKIMYIYHVYEEKIFRRGV
jgi:hypothetical protein